MDDYKDVYGKLTAFIQKLYELALGSENSIKRELYYAEQSETEIAKVKAENLKRLLQDRETILALLELILQKTLKEERIARLPESDRALFEAIYTSPEGERFGVKSSDRSTAYPG